MLKASHKEHEVTVGLKRVLLKPGQFITGRFAGSSELKLKPSTFWKYMLWLRDNQSLNITGNNRYSLISLINWDTYQIAEAKSNSKRDIQNNIPRDSSVTQTIMEEGKNGNVISPNGEITGELAEALAAFMAMRKAIKKPVTARARSMILKKLDEIAATDAEKIAILEQSIMNSWTDIYPLKRSTTPAPPMSGREYLRQKVREGNGQGRDGETVDVFGERVPETD